MVYPSLHTKSRPRGKNNVGFCFKSNQDKYSADPIRQLGFSIRLDLLPLLRCQIQASIYLACSSGSLLLSLSLSLSRDSYIACLFVKVTNAVAAAWITITTTTSATLFQVSSLKAPQSRLIVFLVVVALWIDYKLYVRT